MISPGKPPVELNRLDIKNWTPTPPSIVEGLQQAALFLAQHVDAFVLLDQVDVPETGVVGSKLLQTIDRITQRHPELLILADSRRGLRGFPKVTFKMNSAELARLMGTAVGTELDEIRRQAVALAQKQGQCVFITLSERGIIGASPSGESEHVTAFPVHGEIDIVGAGDTVSASLTTALAAGATLREALVLAMAAASIVVHQLGTTGTASVAQILELIAPFKS